MIKFSANKIERIGILGWICAFGPNDQAVYFKSQNVKLIETDEIPCFKIHVNDALIIEIVDPTEEVAKLIFEILGVIS